MSPLTLVTGATGFIGGYLVRQLLDEGTPVRVVVRHAGRLDPVTRARVEVVMGDVGDPAVLRCAVAGTHTVLHLAACARAWTPDSREFWSVNVGAVESLLQAARGAGVARVVHVSSIVTLPPHRPAPVTGVALRPTPYETTKRIGEWLVESYAASGHDAVVVHPTRVYGPGPLHDANGVTRAVALYLRGRWRASLADGDVLANYVHAADVAAGILLAARHGRRGAHYILGGRENLSFRGLLDLVARLSGRRHRVLPLPPAVALGLARAAVWSGRVGGRVPITPGWVRVFLEDRRADITPACRELGYDPRPLHRGLAETIAWLGRGSDGARAA